YIGADIAELYSHRWEIELGYREMKQSMLQNSLTLRSKTPALVKQELWGMQLQMLPAVAPGRYPEVLRYILDMAESFVLPERRERTYPRAVKKRPSRYAIQKCSDISSTWQRALCFQRGGRGHIQEQ
ncbi:transposase, partial [Vibrio cholerae]|uniref:transposase n=1 Tax=Vibrio cholerae TaxID=666 RepID=UPI003A0FDAE5